MRTDSIKRGEGLAEGPSEDSRQCGCFAAAASVNQHGLSTGRLLTTFVSRDAGVPHVVFMSTEKVALFLMKNGKLVAELRFLHLC